MRQSWQNQNKYKNLVEISKSTDLGGIRTKIRDMFEDIWNEVNKSLSSKQQRPHANIGVFGKIHDQRERPKNFSERSLCFCLLTGPTKEPTADILLNEFFLMSKNYPWGEDSFVRYAAKNNGIFYGKAVPKSEGGIRLKQGGREQDYIVQRVEEILIKKEYQNYKESGKKKLTTWLPGEKFYDRNTEKAYEHVLIIAEDLYELGVWRKPCAVCGAFAIGPVEYKNLSKDLGVYIDFMYLIRSAAFLLTTFCFAEASSHPLEKLSTASRLQIINELKEKERLSSDHRSQLLRLIWELDEGFLKRQALRKLYSDSKSKKMIYETILGDPISSERLKHVAVCQESKYTSWDPKKVLKTLLTPSTNHNKETETPFWILGDLLCQDIISIPNKVVATLDLVKKRVLNLKISPREFYHLWQVALSVILFHAENFRKMDKNRKTSINIIFSFMEFCMDKMSGDYRWNVMAKEISSRAFNVLPVGDTCIDEKLRKHYDTILGPNTIKALNYFKNSLKGVLPAPVNKKKKMCHFIISQKGGVGKSFVAANICAALGEKLKGKKKKICLLETDFAGPTFGYLEEISKEYWSWICSEDAKCRNDNYSNFLSDPEKPNKPLTIKLNNYNIDIFPAFPEFSSQTRSARFEELSSPDDFAKNLDKFIRQIDYDHIIIDTPAELKWMTLAGSRIANWRHGNVLLVTGADRHSYACLPQVASIFISVGIRTAVVFNGVRKLDQVFFGDERSLADYLSTHPRNDDLTIFPNTKITALVQALTRFRTVTKNSVGLNHFIIPWYHELGALESINDMIKVKPDDKEDPWIEVANWLNIQ